MRRILPLRDPGSCELAVFAGIADAGVELAVGAEVDPPAVVDAGLLQPGQHVADAARRAGSARSGCPTPRSGRRTRSGRARSAARPPARAARPLPRPPRPGTVITRRGSPPPAGMRRIRPLSRSATSASPSGRNAIPHGTSSPVATVRRAGGRCAAVAVGVAVASPRSAPVTRARARRRARDGRRVRAGPAGRQRERRERDQPAHQFGGGRCPGSLTTVTKNSSIWRTTSMKRLKSTGLVTYALACRS